MGGLTFEQQLAVALAQGGGLTIAQLSVGGGSTAAASIKAFAAHLAPAEEKSELVEKISRAPNPGAARSILWGALTKEGYGPALEELEKKRGSR